MLDSRTARSPAALRVAAGDMAKLDGVRFDKEYSREIGVLAHKDIVALFQQAQKSAKDADVKAFASKTLPLLEQQLKMGQQLMMAVEKKTALSICRALMCLNCDDVHLSAYGVLDGQVWLSHRRCKWSTHKQ